MDYPQEKRVWTFVFNKKDSADVAVNIQLDIPGGTVDEAADSARRLFASMIYDLNEKFPPKK